jgi:hypothetical protein
LCLVVHSVVPSTLDLTFLDGRSAALGQRNRRRETGLAPLDRIKSTPAGFKGRAFRGHSSGRCSATGAAKSIGALSTLPHQHPREFDFWKAPAPVFPSSLSFHLQVGSSAQCSAHHHTTFTATPNPGPGMDRSRCRKKAMRPGEQQPYLSRPQLGLRKEYLASLGAVKLQCTGSPSCSVLCSECRVLQDWPVWVCCISLLRLPTHPPATDTPWFKWGTKVHGPS